MWLFLYWWPAHFSLQRGKGLLSEGGNCLSNLQSDVAKLKAIISKLGFWGFVELLFHPILVPLYVIPAWVRSLWASRILLWGQWSRYHGFHAQNAINNLFYRTQWININRYGHLSKSP